MFVKNSVVLVVLLSAVKLTITARILFVLPSPSISHHLFYHQIIRALSARGHEIVSIIADPMNDATLTNLTEIDIHNVAYDAFSATELLENTKTETKSQVSVMRQYMPKFKRLGDAIFSAPNVQQFMKDRNQHFDLFISEMVFYAVQFFAFKEHFNCPAVGVFSAGTSADSTDAFGNPSNPNYYVDTLIISGSNLSFWERFELFWHSIEFRLFYIFESLPVATEQVRKYFNIKSDAWELQKSVDVVLENSNPMLFVPRPLVPNWIPIGGLHERKVDPLPRDLQEFLDNSKQGVVYFSLGSNVKSKNLPNEIRESIIRAFEQLPYNILWKWENQTLENQPKNVFIHQWVPQPGVLAHPNLKAFVTQGGLQSLEEAIRSKVPILAIPFGGDQQFNGYRIHDLGIGKLLKLHELTTESLFESISEVAGNPKYKKKMSKFSDLYWDQPTTPMERAIWWIEYVIRHKGAKHLRCPAADLPWHKFLLLDILGLILGIFSLIVIALVIFVRILLRLVYKNSKHKKE